MKYEEMKKAIENAEGIDEVATLREYFENEYEGECRLELSCLLTTKECEYGM